MKYRPFCLFFFDKKANVFCFKKILKKCFAIRVVCGRVLGKGLLWRSVNLK